MTDEVKPRRRRFWKYLLLVTLAGLLVLASFAWYATTDSFQAMVRRRLVAELERVTGGRVDLGGFHTVPFRLQVEVRDLTVHGREGPGEVPYAHLDRLLARIKIISLLETEFGFHSVLLDHPVVHIIVYSDGTTNQPEPKIPRAPKKTPVEQLFSLSIDRLDVQNGELLWNNQRIPLDLVANDLSAGMSYFIFRQRFEGFLILGKVDTKFKDFRPFAWRAEALFALAGDYVEVSSLKWSSGRSHLEASGRVTDFHQPKIDANYDGTLELAEISAITRRREVRAGVLELHGKGSWSLEHFVSDGKFLARDLDWRDKNISFRNASLSSQFSLRDLPGNDQQIKLTQLQGRLLGGTVTGDADLINWLNLRQPVRDGREKIAEQRGIVRLRMRDMSVPALADTFTTPARMLNQMKLVGTVSGTVEARWRGSPRNADAEIALDVAPPGHPSPQELSVTARARAIYRARPQELEVSEFTATTPATQIRAAGKLSSTASLKLSATTTNLGEWQPFILAFRGPSQLPITLRGRATFNGAATGTLSDLNVVGILEIGNFDSLVPATSRTPEKQIHWDSATAFVQLSPQKFAARNGTLRHRETEIHFDVSAGLHNGQFTDNNVFTAHLDMRNAELAEIEALAGYDYPLSGRMNLILQASGTRLNPHGDGHVQLGRHRRLITAGATSQRNQGHAGPTSSRGLFHWLAQLPFLRPGALN